MNNLITAAGIFLIGLPFVILYAICVKIIGWKAASAIFGMAIGLVVLLYVGLALISLGTTGSLPH